ncbi:MAG: hypothetical protein ACREIA_06260 [Opitutaceae bacterium]
MSSEAHAAQDAATRVIESAERSQALFGAKAVAISQLRALAAECATQDWDGNDAAPISPIAVFVAETFVRALPDGLPMPEFSAEPDGAVSLDWIQSRNRLFSLSAGTSNRLAYAWIDGTDRGHAVAGFDGEHIPQRIVEGILAITNHAPAAIGA